MDPNDAEEDPVLLTNEQRIERAILSLPTLAAKDVPLDDSCPICLVGFSTILDSTAEGDDTEMTGVTQLEGCGHLFCRVDLTEWIRGQHGTCPACRHLFLELKPEWEEESSDGDYIPGETDDEMDDFDDTDDDGAPSDLEDPWDSLDVPARWDRIRRSTGIIDPPEHTWFGDIEDGVDGSVGDENLGLSEGVSESFSEASMASGDEEVVEEDDAQVVDADQNEASGSGQVEGSKQ